MNVLNFFELCQLLCSEFQLEIWLPLFGSSFFVFAVNDFRETRDIDSERIGVKWSILYQHSYPRALFHLRCATARFLCPRACKWSKILENLLWGGGGERHFINSWHGWWKLYQHLRASQDWCRFWTTQGTSRGRRTCARSTALRGPEVRVTAMNY